VGGWVGGKGGGGHNFSNKITKNSHSALMASASASLLIGSADFRKGNDKETIKMIKRPRKIKHLYIYASTDEREEDRHAHKCVCKKI